MNRTERTCPICGKKYQDYPAISRKDNRTEICPTCGTRESLAMLGASEDEIERIIKKIEKKTKDSLH